jgi:hypothetical protein
MPSGIEGSRDGVGGLFDQDWTDARQGLNAGPVSFSPDIQSWVRNALSSQRWEVGAFGQTGGQSQFSTGMLSNSNLTPLQREQAKAALSRILARRNTQDGGINAILQSANAHRTTEKGGLSACVLCGVPKITTYSMQIAEIGSLAKNVLIILQTTHTKRRLWLPIKLLAIKRYSNEQQ